MIIIDYEKKYHKKIIHACVAALKRGKVVAYPTDTSYGLAADSGNLAAVKKVYKIKQRAFSKPIHVVVPSAAFARKIVRWNSSAGKLTKVFWPGPLTCVLPLKSRIGGLKILSAGTGFLGLRLPNNLIALDLVKNLGRPITTPSANPPSGHGGDDSYSAREIISQFKGKKFKPDIIIDAGKLAKRKPSTLVKIVNNRVEILRQGPISQTKITNILKNGFVYASVLVR